MPHALYCQASVVGEAAQIMCVSRVPEAVESRAARIVVMIGCWDRGVAHQIGCAGQHDTSLVAPQGTAWFLAFAIL